MTHHFWDFTDAKLASVATAQAKARKGWKLYKVSQGFTACAGVASYEHALVGPAGELLKVSTRTVQAAGVPVEPYELALSMQVLLLKGVFKADLILEVARRGLAHTEDLGARWNGERRCWMVRPESRDQFAAWLSPEDQAVPMFEALPSSS